MKVKNTDGLNGFMFLTTGKIRNPIIGIGGRGCKQGKPWILQKTETPNRARVLPNMVDFSSSDATTRHPTCLLIKPPC
jgi:hypothetical protein